MEDLSRRILRAASAVGSVAAAAAAAHAVTLGNPDEPAQGAISSTPKALDLVSQNLNIEPAIIAQFHRDQLGLQPGLR